MDYSSTPTAQHMLVGAGTAAVPSEVARYDFREGGKLPEVEIGRLRRLNQRFGGDLADTLSALARRQITVQATSLEQVKALGSALEDPDGALKFLLDIQPIGVPAFLSVNSALIFAFLEALLGAKSARTENPSRELTEVEQSVLRDIDRVIMQELESAWRAETGLSCAIHSHKTRTISTKMAASRDSFVIGSTVFSLDGELGKLTLFYPTQIVQAFGGPPPQEPPAALPSNDFQQGIFERIRASKLVIEGCLQDSTVRLADLLELQPGDLLRLDLPLNLPLDIHLNGHSRFQAEFFQNDRKKAMRIQNLGAKKTARN